MKDLRERLAAQGVHTLLAQFTDLGGVAKGKLVPLAQLDALLADGVAFSGPSIAGTGLPRTGPRSAYWARGAASTASALPWQPGLARIVCDGFVAGQPFEACPRQILRRQTARLSARGWRLALGFEPEFFLLRRRADGGYEPADLQDRLDKPSYDLRSLLRQQDLLIALQRALEAAGLQVLQIDHEDAWGQYELNIGFDEALASCDHQMLLRLAAATLAEARGLVFSLCPKPFADQPGSGLHGHVSLWQAQRRDERNLFVPHRADGTVDTEATLSPLGRQFAAGLLAHAPALTALSAPTVNSYRRLQVGPSRSGTSWAPATISHGPDNRTALLRTLHGRFEWRLPDAAANPYLAAAGLIAAGLDGIDRALDLPAPCEDDLFEAEPAALAARGLALLPRNLDEALDALQADTVLAEALGPLALAQYLALKRAEAAELHGQGLEAELRRYADIC